MTKEKGKNEELNKATTDIINKDVQKFVLQGDANGDALINDTILRH